MNTLQNPPAPVKGAMIPFNFDNRAVRTGIKDGRPFLVAADVCRILGIKNTRDAYKRLHEDEKGVASTDTLGGSQMVQICYEPGLYRLIFSSRRPAAERFKRWVFHEVLPALARTGRYEAEPARELELAQWELQRAKARRRLYKLLGDLEAEPEPGTEYSSLTEFFARLGRPLLTFSERSRLGLAVERECRTQGLRCVTRWAKGRLAPTRLWPVQALRTVANGGGK